MVDLVEGLNEGQRPAAHDARQDQRQGHAAEQRPVAGAERDRRHLDRAVHAGCRGQRQPQREREHHDDVGDAAAPVKVPPCPIAVKKRRKAMPSTTCGIISGDRNSAARLAATELVARDGKRRRHREQERHHEDTAPSHEADPEGVDELGIVRDRPEPAQRETGRSAATGSPRA